MANLFITRPEHENAVAYLSYWGEEILKFAKDKSIAFSDFRREKANRIEVEKYLKSQNPKLVVFNGHGSSKMICGHRDEPLIVSNENENLLSSKIIYAISCEAAKELGPNAVDKKMRGICWIRRPVWLCS